MIDYSKLTYQLKRETKKFTEKVTKNLSRPKQKLVFQMFYGLLESQSTHLSKIARALKEKTILKKTIDRLSRNLNRFTETDIIFDNYLDIAKKHTNDSSIIIVDHSDITKPHSKCLDSLCKVRDGSTGNYGIGYHLLEMAVLTPKTKMPLPVYSSVYSSTEQDFKSEDDEVLKGLKFVSKHFGKKNIRTLDRGYDANIYFKHFMKNKEQFVIRMKKNRNVIYNGKTYNILDLARKFKGKYKLNFNGKKGEKISCKISYIPISLPLAPNVQLTLTVVYGFGKTPMMLISSLKSTDKKLVVVITKVYLMRWRIEEYYRFKKQQFKFEDFRVQSLNSIRALNTILSILIGLLATFSEKQDDNLLIMAIIDCSKRIYGKSKFIYYALGDGIFNILNKTKTGIEEFIKKKKEPPSQQLDIFNVFNIDESKILGY